MSLTDMMKLDNAVEKGDINEALAILRKGAEDEKSYNDKSWESYGIGNGR